MSSPGVLPPEVPVSVREFLGTVVGGPMGSAERSGRRGQLFTTVNPATGEVLAEIAAADEDDVDKAVMTARRAHDEGTWRGLDPADRARILLRTADLIEQHSIDFMWIETLDHGKPLSHAMGEVRAAAKCFRYFAGWVDKMYGEVIPTKANRMVYTRRQPVGVCAQIIPWNFPLLMATWK